MSEIGVALLGLGTVGKGVIDLLEMNGNLIEKQLGCKFSIKKALVRDIKKYRRMKLPKSLQLTTDFNDILQDESIQLVIEVMGGVEFAKACILSSFKAGKNVASANKDLIASHMMELLAAAEEAKVDFLFEASVAGGIPIIRPLYDSLASNAITEIIGVVNGTTNYILSNMTEKGLSFQAALTEAQERGYAEADPTSDVGGYDAARKIAILGTLGFHTRLTFEDVTVEGIENIDHKDIVHAKDLGYVIKLLAIAKETNKGISLSVHPALISQKHPLASVNGANNAIYLEGNCVGNVMFYGQGAGDMPTATSVVSDAMSIAKNINNGNTGNMRYFWRNDCKKYSALRIKTPYYFRMVVDNAPGVLAAIAGVFGEFDISIRSLIQRDETKEIAEIVIVTDAAPYGNTVKALKRLELISCVRKVASKIRVVEVN